MGGGELRVFLFHYLGHIPEVMFLKEYFTEAFKCLLFLTLIIIGGQFLYTSGYYHAIRGGMIEEQNKEKALDYYKQAFSKNPGYT